MLQPFPLFGVGVKGKSSPVCAQERVNLLSEVDQETGQLKLYPTPGTTVFVNFGANPIRGLYTRGDYIYAVNGTTLWEVANDGTMTSRGTLLTSSGRVDMVDNGEGGQLLILDGTRGYTYTFDTTTFAQILDADFVAGDTCAFLNGYFVVQRANSSQFGLSYLYDGTNWNALDYSTAESSPGNLVRVKSLNGVLIFFKEKATEFWGTSGADDFPFARMGSSGVPWGLAARWSLTDFMGGLMFLGRDALGAVQVFSLNGFQAAPVSTAEIDHNFSTYTAENATACSYMVSGHPLYQISFPTDDVSWVYDGLTQEWHRAQYSTAGRHRAEIQVNYLNRAYVSDYENGMLYRMDPNTYTDNGTVIVREFVTQHVKSGEPSTLAQLWLEMEAGTGLQTGQGSDPQVMLQISRDGGKTWDAEIWRGFGAVGKYLTRAVWNRLGQSRSWTFKFRVTDPVKTVFIAAWARYVR